MSVLFLCTEIHVSIKQQVTPKMAIPKTYLTMSEIFKADECWTLPL